jgi:DNA-binding Lrp family transcriptional regulator
VSELELIGVLSDVTRPNVLELSRRTGQARNTVQARIERLQRSGVVTGYEPVVDLAAAGYGVVAFTTLEIAQGQERPVIDGLGRIAEVLEVHKITGPGDLLCRIVARTNEHLHDVLEQVLVLQGIVRTTSVLALTSPIRKVHPAASAVAALTSTSAAPASSG